MLLNTPNLNSEGDEAEWNVIGCNTKQYPNKTPSKRWGQSLCEANDKLYVFGGYAELSYFNELWTFDLKNFHWELLPLKEGCPDPRSNHTMLNDPRSARLILFGGSGAKKKRFNDLYLFDTEKKTWNAVETEAESKPTARTYHAAALVDQCMVIHGGEGTEDLDDLHILELKLMNWNQPNIVGPKPGRRRFHSANAIGKSVLIFGGCYQNYLCYGDFWQIDLARYFEDKSNFLNWLQIDIKGEVPSPRWGHLALTKTSYLLLFGGKTSVDTADLYAINLDTNGSQQILTKSTPIGRRKPGGMLYKNHLLIYGGYNGSYLADLLCLNLGLYPMRIAEKTLEEEFKTLFLLQEPENMTLYFNKIKVFVHSFLLQRSDPSFSKILTKNEREIKMEIPEISDNHFRLFAQFLYTNHLEEEIEDEELKSLLTIAQVLKLQETEQYLRFAIAYRESKDTKAPLTIANMPISFEGGILSIIQHLREFEKVAESPEDIKILPTSGCDWLNVYQIKLLAVLNTDPDFLLYSENFKYPCHRTVLAIRSAYFKNMFKESFKESLADSLTVPLKNKESLLTLMYYIYFDIEEEFFKKTITREDDWNELMIFSKYAHLERLANFCEFQLASYFTSNNVIDYLHTSRKYSCQILAASVLNHIIKNFSQLKLKTRLVIWESENKGKSKEFAEFLNKELEANEFLIARIYNNLKNLGLILNDSGFFEELIDIRNYLREISLSSESCAAENLGDLPTLSNKIYKGLH